MDSRALGVGAATPVQAGQVGVRTRGLPQGGFDQVLAGQQARGADGERRAPVEADSPDATSRAAAADSAPAEDAAPRGAAGTAGGVTRPLVRQVRAMRAPQVAETKAQDADAAAGVAPEAVPDAAQPLASAAPDADDSQADAKVAPGSEVAVVLPFAWLLTVETPAAEAVGPDAPAAAVPADAPVAAVGPDAPGEPVASAEPPAGESAAPLAWAPQPTKPFMRAPQVVPTPVSGPAEGRAPAAAALPTVSLPVSDVVPVDEEPVGSVEMPESGTAAPEDAAASTLADATSMPPASAAPVRAAGTATVARETARRILAAALKETDGAVPAPPAATPGSSAAPASEPTDQVRRTVAGTQVLAPFMQSRRPLLESEPAGAAVENASSDAVGVTPQVSVAWTGDPRGESGRQGASHGWQAFATTPADTRTAATQSTASAAPVFLDTLGTTSGAAVAPGPEVQADVPAQGTDAHVARQIVRAVSLAWRDEVGEATVRLTPEHLGEVNVAIRVERGAVSAVLQADTASAREWIRAHETDLREGLESQGLSLKSLVVTEDGGSRRGQEEAPPQNRRRPGRSAAGLPVFEVEA